MKRITGTDSAVLISLEPEAIFSLDRGPKFPKESMQKPALLVQHRRHAIALRSDSYAHKMRRPG